MKIKKFHLKDFPEERIRILFKNNEKFLDESIDHFGSLKNLADFLSVSPQTIPPWKKLNLFIPLQHIKKIVNERKLDWSEIEKNVVAYKGPNLSLEIRNPKLPIIESPDLFAIMSHLIGDGSVNKNGIPIYTNSNKKLIDNFQKLITDVFGNVKGKVYKSNSGAFQVRTSKVISDLIKSFYNINFDSLTAKIPTRIFELPEKYSCSIIRAIVDDEGTIRDNRIPIKMHNKYLMMQIRRILVKIFGNEAISSLACRKDGSWEVCIKSKYLKVFKRKIKLVHTKKKNDLRYAIKKAEYRGKKHRDDLWKTKFRILNILSNKSKIINDLAKKLYIDKGNLISHIEDLEGELLIEKRNHGKSYICSLTKEGKIFLKENFPSDKKISINLNKINYNTLSKKHIRILLNKESREKLFWFLETTCGNQSKIAKLFNVHHNTISYWKNGNTLIPSFTLNKMLIFLGKNGIDLVNEVNTNLSDIRTINGRYKIYGGMNYDVRIRKPTFT